MESNGPNVVATTIAGLTGKAVNALEKKKGSILGMHETFLKHQLSHEDFLKRTAVADRLAKSGSKLQFDGGNGVKISYTKGGNSTSAKPTTGKKPAAKASTKPAAKPVPKKAPAKKTMPTVTTTVPVKKAAPKRNIRTGAVMKRTR